MNGPRTSREVLIAEVLGELDVLLTRVEGLTQSMTCAEQKLLGSISSLDDAGERYRVAVSVYTEETKAALKDYLELKAGIVASDTAAEQRAAMQEAARQAFLAEAVDSARTVRSLLESATHSLHRTFYSRLIGHAVTALIASAVTTAIISAAIRMQ